MRFGSVKKEKPHMEITSLIDIIFILLVFFMISSSFIKPVVRLKLPVSATMEKPPKKNKIILTFTKNNELYFNRQKIRLDELQTLTEKELQKETNTVAIFYGDERMAFKKFLLIVDILKNSGVKGIAIGHKTKD